MDTRNAWVIVLLVVASSSSAVGSGWGAATAPARPGNMVGDGWGSASPTDDDVCTAGFLMGNQTRLFVATAGHCFQNAGFVLEPRYRSDRTVLVGGAPIGTLEFWPSDGDADVALVALESCAVAFPAMHTWSAPTGVARPYAGELAGLHGRGADASSGALKNGRTGAVSLAEASATDPSRLADVYTTIATSVGDSGAPVVRLSDRGAIGLHVGLNEKGSHAIAMDAIETTLRANGHFVDLVTTDAACPLVT